MKNRNYQIYFINTLASGLFYSYVTRKLLEMNVSNSLLTITISSVVSLLILFDIRGRQLLGKLSIQYYPVLALVISGISVLYISHSSVGFYLSFYFFMSIIFSILLLYFESRIIDDEITFTLGFLNTQLIRTTSKMLGFFLGILLGQARDERFLIYLFIFCMLLNVWGTFHVQYKKTYLRTLPISSGQLRGVDNYLILGFLTTSTLTWIPILTREFIQEGLGNYSWLPFVLPGFCSILFTNMQKKYNWLFSSIFMEFSYIFLLLTFLFLRLLHISIWVETILFSLITAVGLSLSIRPRKRLLEANVHHPTKYILQTIDVNASIFSLVVSLFGNFLQIIEIGLVLTCVSSTVYMIFKRKEF